MRNIYIIDNILLFNPELEKDQEIYRYEDIEKQKKKISGIFCVYFVTSDIRSVFNITAKISIMYSYVRPLAIILKDDREKRIITPFHLPCMMLRCEMERRKAGAWVKTVEGQVDGLKNWNGRKRIRKGAVPIYIKTTMCYGVQSGGAVAHSAGVLKSLIKEYGALNIYTTDYIPEEIEGGNIYHIPMHGFHDFYETGKLFFNISAYREICKRQKDIVPAFVYQRYELDDYLGLKISKKYKVPLVLEWNGSAVWISKSWDGSDLSYRNLSEKIENLNLEKADLIVCGSHEAKAALTGQGVDSEKILVDFNGVDVEKYTPDVEGDHVRKKYGINDRTVIGFCGSFGKFHGAEKLAQAYGNMLLKNEKYRGNTCLMLIGEGSTLPEVKRILNRFKVSDCVRYAGSIPFEKMPSYLAACDILVAPHVPNKDKSEFFGSPTKLFEYMAMGKAIAASDLNQIGTVLSDRESALLFEPGNIEEMERAMIMLIEDRELRERLGKKAREKAVENYAWDKHVEKILLCLEGMYRQ